MHRIGFSTGALAYGDFRRGTELQRGNTAISAIELSALRERELEPLIEAIPELKLNEFEFKSFHAPSGLEHLTCAELVERLRPIADAGFPIVVHPDIIGTDFAPWRSLGTAVLLENMDVRKSVCRTATEMSPFFAELPDARLCFDLGHARRVDPTMAVGAELLLRFHDRLAEIHISEVTWNCKHVGINTAAAESFRRIARLIPETIPVIIESVIDADEIDFEVDIAQRCLDWRAPLNELRAALAAIHTGYAEM